MTFRAKWPLQKMTIRGKITAAKPRNGKMKRRIYEKLLDFIKDKKRVALVKRHVVNHRQPSEEFLWLRKIRTEGVGDTQIVFCLGEIN